jgi:hypothetical protein
MIEARRARWAGYVVRIGTSEVHTEFLWGTLKVRPRRRWEANIKMILKEIDLEGMDFTYPVQEGGKWRALVNAAMNRRVP